MADDEQFSLCWNNFNSNLSAGFHESLCRGDLVDVTLAAEGQLVKAHRLVLSVCSPYFRKMFTQMPANQHAFVFLKDVSHSALKDLIQFMYCGEVNVKQEALPAFISTAEALQIKGLTDSDPSPSGQPPSEPTTPTPQMPQVQTSPRLRQQRTVAATRSYKIETVDETSNDSKPQTTQIVIQTTAAQVSQPTAITITQPTATIQHHHHQHQQQQHHHHMQTQHHHQQQQQLQSQSHQISTVSIPSGTVSTVANAATHVVGSSHKRPAQRSSLGSVTHMKRSKTSTIDPLEGAEANGGGGVGAATQQITIQTAIVSDTKTQQQQQNEAAEYIDLPLELPTKSEPDYTDETGEVDPNEQDATYVEDESYGDIRYDESYFAENEDGGGGGGVATTGATTTAVGNINVNNTTNAGNVTVGIGSAASGGGGVVGSAAATTSKAIIKQQQNTSFSDSSYADGTDQTNNDAQEGVKNDEKKTRFGKRSLTNIEEYIKLEQQDNNAIHAITRTETITTTPTATATVETETLTRSIIGDGGTGGIVEPASIIPPSNQGGPSFVFSKYGTRQLMYKHHTFNRHVSREDVTYWRCSQFAVLRCRARIKTNGNTLTVLNCEHNHEVITKARKYGSLKLKKSKVGLQLLPSQQQQQQQQQQSQQQLQHQQSQLLNQVQQKQILKASRSQNFK